MAHHHVKKPSRDAVFANDVARLQSPQALLPSTVRLRPGPGVARLRGSHVVFAGIATTSMWRLGTSCKRMQVIAEFAVPCMTCNIAPLFDTQLLEAGPRIHAQRSNPLWKNWSWQIVLRVVHGIPNRKMDTRLLVYMEYLQRRRSSSIQIGNKKKNHHVSSLVPDGKSNAMAMVPPTFQRTAHGAPNSNYTL